MERFNLDMTIVVKHYSDLNLNFTTSFRRKDEIPNIQLNDHGMIYRFYMKNDEAYTGKGQLVNLKWVTSSRAFAHKKGDVLFENYSKMTKCEILCGIPMTLVDDIETLLLWESENAGRTFMKWGSREWDGKSMINKDKKINKRTNINKILLNGNNKIPSFKWQTYFN